MPPVIGEPVEGDARAVGGESGELGLHGVGAVVGESEAIEVAPVDDGGDAILLLVPCSEKVPEFVCGELSLGGWSRTDVNSLVVEECGVFFDQVARRKLFAALKISVRDTRCVT